MAIVCAVISWDLWQTFHGSPQQRADSRAEAVAVLNRQAAGGAQATAPQ